MKLRFPKMFAYQEEEEKERKRILSYVAGFFAACSVILIILVSVQAGQSHPKSTSCPTFPPLDYFELHQKRTNVIWHWTKQMQNARLGETEVDLSFYTEERCPTDKDDVHNYLNGGFMGTTNGQITQTHSRCTIQDCQNRGLYFAEAGSVFKTEIDEEEVLVSLVVRNLSGDIIVYVEEDTFWDNLMTLKAPGNQTLATITMMKTSSMHILTYESTFPNATDPMLVSSIFSKRDFGARYSSTKNGRQKAKDSCNTCWIVGMVFIFLFAGGSVWTLMLK